MDHILRIHTEEDHKEFSFICDKRLLSLCYSDILFLEEIDNYILIHDSRDISYKTRRAFSSVENALSSERRFLKVNHGIIVNMDYIQDITDSTCHLQGGLCLPIDQKKSRGLQLIWHNYYHALNRRNHSK